MMKITQSALAQPLRSWLRKTSLKTMISSQIQMKNMKNHRNDQNTWPVPKSAASVIPSPRIVGLHACARRDAPGWSQGAAPASHGRYRAPETEKPSDP